MSSNPLICNSNSLHHIDYGKPIVSNKSTNYSSQYKSYHDLYPENPINFDSRIKINLRPDLKYRDAALKELTYQSIAKDYNQKYKMDRICDNYEKAPRTMANYIRNVQEKLFADPPPPLKPVLSEMKDNFRINYYNPDTREVFPPAISAVCAVRGLGRDEQPPLRPGEKGFWKWMDPYLTTNKSAYVQFSKDQRAFIKKDLPTFYNTCGKWKGFDESLPPRSGNKCVYDKNIIKHQVPNRILPKIIKRVPNPIFTSEYKSQYDTNSRSDLSPYIDIPMEEFQFLSGAPAAEYFAPPGMYKTEYSHIGSKYSCRNVIDIDKSKQKFKESCKS